MNELISIIVPVYNVEKYLNKCVDSILAQTYTNIEVILINDGSKDKSGEICNDYSKIDNRIKVIHQTQHGVAYTRNVGINNSNGKYILFVDSDDFIDKKMIKTLYKTIVSDNSDIAICDFIYYTEKTKKNNKYPKKVFMIEGNEKFEYLYNEYYIASIVQWNKLFKKEIFNDIRYPEGKINEDEFVIAKEFFNAKKISYVLEPLYYYNQREGSIMHTLNINRFDIINVLENRINFFKEKNLKKYVIQTKIQQLDAIIVLLSEFSNSSILKKEKNTINNYIKQVKYNTKTVFWKKIGLKNKIKIIMFSINPKIAEKCLKFVLKTQKKF